MNSQLDTRGSIVNHIIDGRVKVDSEGEFENLLKVFPNNPSLYRAFGDWLAQRKSFDAAADTYGMAAELFIDSGLILQAMVSKIHQRGFVFLLCKYLHGYFCRQLMPDCSSHGLEGNLSA